MIGAIFGPSINNKLGLKISFFLGGFSLALFVFALILPAWRADKIKDDPNYDNFWANKYVVITLLGVSYAVSGFGSVVLWVA